MILNNDFRISNRFDWYHNYDHQYKIIGQLYNREFALLIPPKFINEKDLSLRFLRAHNIQSLRFLLDFWKFEELNKPYNFYATLAKYNNGVPQISYKGGDAWENRREIIKKWRGEHESNITGYDFLIDIDCDNFDNFDYTLESAKIIVSLFNRLKTPFKLKFSGKGFHITIPSEYLPNLSFISKEEDNIYTFCADIAKKLNKEYSCLIDTSIYDSLRLCKLAHTVVIYPNHELMVSVPVSPSQLENFNINFYTFKQYIQFMVFDNQPTNLYNPIYNKDGTIHSLLDHIKKSIKAGDINGRKKTNKSGKI